MKLYYTSRSIIVYYYCHTQGVQRNGSQDFWDTSDNLKKRLKGEYSFDLKKFFLN